MYLQQAAKLTTEQLNSVKATTEQKIALIDGRSPSARDEVNAAFDKTKRGLNDQLEVVNAELARRI